MRVRDSLETGPALPHLPEPMLGALLPASPWWSKEIASEGFPGSAAYLCGPRICLLADKLSFECVASSRVSISAVILSGRLKLGLHNYIILTGIMVLACSLPHPRVSSSAAVSRVLHIYYLPLCFTVLVYRQFFIYKYSRIAVVL